MGRPRHDRLSAPGLLCQLSQGRRRPAGARSDDRADRRPSRSRPAVAAGDGAVPAYSLKGDAMQATRTLPTGTLHDLGQSLWLDNITRELLNSGTLKRYIDELSVTGLTSNPTIFDHAIGKSSTYDADIAGK